MSSPHNHGDLAPHIIDYLAAAGVVRPPTDDMRAEHPLPAVYAHSLRDAAAGAHEAVAVVGPSVEQDPTHSNPDIRFLVVIRSAPWDLEGLHRIGQSVTSALHHDRLFPLTATRSLAYCNQVLTDQPVQDENKRWVRVDTYRARARVPNT